MFLTPSQDITQLELRSDLQRKSDFLKFLVIGLIALLSLALVIMILPPTSSLASFVVIGFVLFLNLVVFYLNKQGFVRFATHLFCQTFNINILIAVIANTLLQDSNQLALSNYLLALTVLLAGMLISRNAILGFAGLNLSAIFLSAIVVNPTSGQALIASFPIIFFLVFITIISWLYQRTLEQSHVRLNLAHAQLLETQLISRDLEIARDLQEQLYPSPPQIGPQLTIASRSKPARETSGDFYDFVWLKSNQLGIVIADVTGKSIAAALVMAMTRSTLRSEMRRYSAPATVLHQTNQVLCQDSTVDQMITTFYGVLNIEKLTLHFSNAGHIFPTLKRNSTVKDLEMTGLPLSAIETAHYQEALIQLETGDQLVLVTDGLIEAINSEDEMFGFDRLAETIRQNEVHDPHQTIDIIWQAVDNFLGEEPPQDDRTIVVIAVN